MGNQQSQEKTAKFVAKSAVGIAVGSMLGSLAFPVGATSWGASKIVIECCENEEIVEFFDCVKEISGDVALGGAISGGLNAGTKLCGNLAASNIAKNGRGMTNGAKVLINAGKTIKKGKIIYNLYDKAKEWGLPVWKIKKHNDHIEEGIEYDSECEVCKI